MKKYKSLIFAGVVLIIIGLLLYYFIPASVHPEYIGEVNIDSRIDRNEYFNSPERTPVGWSGSYFCQVDKPSSYQPYLLRDVLEHHLIENNEKEMSYIYSWGKPIKRFSYLRYSKYVPQESIGDYIGRKASYLTKAIFDSTKIENKLYVYRIKDIELYSLYEDCIDEYADIYISNGLGYDTIKVPYSELR